MTATYYTTTNTYYAVCAVLALMIVLRLRTLVKLIGWRGIVREIRHMV